MNKQSDRFRLIPLLISGVAASGSLALMLYTGRHNKSILLLAAFVIWVLSPFVILWLGIIMSKRWSPLTLNMIYHLLMMVAFSSLLGYGTTFIYPIPKPASVYLIVPFIAWLIIVTLLPLVERRARGLKKGS